MYLNGFYFQKFENEYHKQLATGTVSQETKFHYAWCLVRSNYPADIRKGLILLEQLIKHEANDEDAKRNYLYYLALGNSRIKVSIILYKFDENTALIFFQLKKG